MTTHENVARAFPGHRSEETFGHLADPLVGVTTTFTRFVSLAADDVSVVDGVAGYDGPHSLTGVLSGDVSEFSGNLVTTITSHTVLVDPDDPGAPPVETHEAEPDSPVPDAPAGPTDPPADPDEPLNPA